MDYLLGELQAEAELKSRGNISDYEGNRIFPVSRDDEVEETAGEISIFTSLGNSTCSTIGETIVRRLLSGRETGSKASIRRGAVVS